MSQLMFWNKQNSSSNKDPENSNSGGGGSKSGAAANDAKSGKRNWLHTPEALLNGHVVYLVKFFGNLPVEQAKGIEVVKDAIRKLQFAQQMKKAETGTQEKFKKVEITISVDGVAVQEPRTQKILHQFPLHNISYCADEKGVKKFFSFIVKTARPVDSAGAPSSTNGYGSANGAPSGATEETHECFVFISNKLASDITLTIGQAFDLAFRKYISSTEKSDLGKAQQQIAELEKTIAIYKERLREVSQKLSKADLDTLLFKMSIKDILDIPSSASESSSAPLTNGSSSKLANDDKLLIDTNSCHSSTTTTTTSSSSSSRTSSFLPTVPPRSNIPSQILPKSNSQKMEELLLNSDSDSDFDPRAEETTIDGGGGTGGGSNSNNNNSNSVGKNVSNDLFGFEPPKSYGQQLFYNNNNNNNDNKLPNNNSTHASNNNFSELTITPPLLAPPPKAAVPRRNTTSVANNNNSATNNMSNGNGPTDLFGSDLFDFAGPSIFKKQLGAVSVDDFTLESLDPLRK